MPTAPQLAPQIEQFLHDNPQGVMTSFRRNGMPQLSIVTVYPRDGGVGVSITENRMKFKNLLRDPRCSLLVSHVDWWSGFLVFEGTVELTHSGNTDPEALRMARRHIFSATTRRRSASLGGVRPHRERRQARRHGAATAARVWHGARAHAGGAGEVSGVTESGVAARRRGAEARPAAAPPERFYLPSLDGLRFFAFLAVFRAHAAPRPMRASFPWLGPFAPVVDSVFRAGLYGVDLFFVLSAFLITGLLMREAEAQGRIGIGAFYVRRALRIWPLYYAAIAFFVFVVPRIIVDDFPLPHVVGFSLLVGNWANLIYGTPKSVASPLWSISVEEQFYLAWPLLIAAFGVRRIPHIAVGALALTFAARAIIMLDGGRHDLWHNTFTRLDSIALGALIAVLTRRGVPSLSGRARVSLVGAGVLVWIVAAHLFFRTMPQLSFPLVSLASAAMLVAAFDPPTGRASWLAQPWLVYLGRISYGLYVFHQFGIQLVVQRAPSLPNRTATMIVQLALAFGITVGLAALSYHFLERPFLKLKARVTMVPSRPDTS